MMVASAVRVVTATSRHLLKEGADGDRIGRVVGPLVDHLEDVVGADDRGGDLHPAGAPAVGHRHFAGCERHLVAGDGDPLQDRTADHPLGLLVEIGEVVAGDSACMVIPP